VPDEDREELVKYLSTICKEVKKDDPVRWQEHGILPDAVPPHRVLAMRQTVADTAGTWTPCSPSSACMLTALLSLGFRLASLMRYSTPIRLGEVSKHLEEVKLKFEYAYNNWKVATIHADTYALSSYTPLPLSIPDSLPKPAPSASGSRRLGNKRPTPSPILLATPTPTTNRSTIPDGMGPW
jgi:hypothetical protein